ISGKVIQSEDKWHLKNRLIRKMIIKCARKKKYLTPISEMTLYCQKERRKTLSFTYIATNSLKSHSNKNCGKQ
uniref:Uncharacterized protein n=1 Tax=Poecilia formosa TaxID=48698 RepID=A0A096M808_POEFO